MRAALHMRYECHGAFVCCFIELDCYVITYCISKKIMYVMILFHVYCVLCQCCDVLKYTGGVVIYMSDCCYYSKRYTGYAIVMTKCMYCVPPASAQ